MAAFYILPGLLRVFDYTVTRTRARVRAQMRLIKKKSRPASA